jgi:acetoin utilization deacetylase AcuC-like enzyme
MAGTQIDERLLLVRDPRFREHAPWTHHPERPERLDAADRGLAALAPERLAALPARSALDEEILRVHSREHLEALRSIEGRRAELDEETYASERSIEVARLAAGSTVELALRVGRGEARRGFALLRPPGHHAERSGAMGFCLLNQVAMAACALEAELGVERIAILDWDVHHGNGTQHSFERERDVLFISLHQFPLYPGTGALGEQGEDTGRGSTVNLPLPAGCGDAEYEAVVDGVVLPVLAEFRPEIVLVSAGFDAHERDPLASMRVTSRGFGRIAARVRALTDDVCAGRLVLALEGGYDLDALGESVYGVVTALAGNRAGDRVEFVETAAAKRLREVFRDAHSRHWKRLRHPSA